MTLFTVEKRKFGWDEIIVAAQLWNEWGPFVETVYEAQSCLQFANETKRVPTSAEMRETANSFRYSHNLISGEETQLWLERWGMSAGQWMDCLRGLYVRQQWLLQAKQIANCYNSNQDNDLLKNYAVCTGKLDEWATRLAGHAAIAAASNDLLDESVSTNQLIEQIEEKFQQGCKQRVTNQLVEAKICDHRLEWIHYECRCLWLPEEAMAREAALCVSEDGLTLDQVAADAQCELREWNFYADEIEISVRPYFLAARPGDLLGPWRLREKYPLFSVLSKRLPHSDDPRIRTRAEDAIVAGLLAQAINERVHWVEQSFPQD